MILETKRLILRSWEENDAIELYKYASNPTIGSSAGWHAHINVEYSLRIIQTILSKPETYAIILKNTGLPIGSISLKFYDGIATRDDESALGYWLGVPYWGKGLMTEAVIEILRHAFNDLHLERIWGCYYNGNNRSERVLTKCGFEHHRIMKDILVLPLGERRTCHVSLLTKKKWQHNVAVLVP